MQEVAPYRGNTPAVCRSSYVDPRIIDRYREGATIRPAVEKLGGANPAEGAGLARLNAIEAAVLDLLDEDGADSQSASASTRSKRAS